MKKLISVILALAVVMCLGTVALAAEGDQTGVAAGSYTTDVTGTYVPGTTESETIFSVDIAWSAMSFKYNAAKAPEWSVTDHKYSEGIEAFWEGTGTITVTNHSNTQISAEPAFTPADGFSEVSMKFSPEKLTVDTAETGNAAKSGEITVTPDGHMAEAAESTKIGTITVTIAEVKVKDVTVEEVQSLIDATKYEQDAMYYDSTYSEEQKQSLTEIVNGLETALINFNNNNISQNELNSIYNEALETYKSIVM